MSLEDMDSTEAKRHQSNLFILSRHVFFTDSLSSVAPQELCILHDTSWRYICTIFNRLDKEYIAVEHSYDIKAMELKLKITENNVTVLKKRE